MQRGGWFFTVRGQLEASPRAPLTYIQLKHQLPLRYCAHTSENTQIQHFRPSFLRQGISLLRDPKNIQADFDPTDVSGGGIHNMASHSLLWPIAAQQLATTTHSSITPNQQH